MLETLILDEMDECGLGAHHLLRVAELDGAIESLECGLGMVLLELGERGEVLNNYIICAQGQGRLRQGALRELSPSRAWEKANMLPRHAVVRVYGDAALRERDGAPVNRHGR